MKLDDFLGFVTWMDDLSDQEFERFYSLMSIRALRRRRRPNTPPKSPPEGELKDCHPNDKRKDSALDAL